MEMTQFSHHFTFLLLILVSLFNVSLATKLCNPHDEKALFHIKKQLGDPPSLYYWDFSKDCCKDWGIYVHCNDQGRVSYINIPNAVDAKGNFPSAFGNLPFLESLNVVDIPGVSGPIPSSISKLTKLTSFGIVYSNMSGPIPDFIGQFKNLSQLFLDSNNFTGPIPRSLGQLTKLEYLHLGKNKLSGHIPDMFTKMGSLRSVDLSSNVLSGPIPRSLSLSPRLTHLSLSQNRLTGLIPKSLSRPSVQLVDLSFNRFAGDASFLFARKNTAMSYVYLNNNLLKFDFTNVDFPNGFIGFNVSHNMIYGSLPKRLGQSSMEFIDVSTNQLCGPIPQSPWLQQLSPEYFDHNKCLCGRPLPPCK